jgi:hypothetical protein
MRYITRQLYQSMQDGSGLPPEEVNRRWHEACESYLAEFNSIKPGLPPGMRSFAEVTLHDAVVKSAYQPRPGCVELQMDATNSPWGPAGWYRIEFQGVREVQGLAEITGDDWLYEEVHLHPSGAFEYCVLLSRSQFRVVADDVIFEQMPICRPSPAEAGSHGGAPALL